MKKPVQPCGRNCPKREAGCAVECVEWAEYVKARGEYYTWRHEIKKAANAERDRAIDRFIRRHKEGFD